MVYEGFLKVGGTEIVNNERIRGYAQTSDCDLSFIQGPGCDTLQDALGDAPYTMGNIPLAPWYDQSLPDLSSRFLGVYALGVSGLSSSTRSSQITEGIDDGGTIGSTRKGMLSARVRATLIAQGRDALDYGVHWLNSALDANRCGQHGRGCGTMDVEFLSDCPPPRSIVREYTPWLEMQRNMYGNPSFEADSGATVEVRRNLAQNPKMELHFNRWGGSGAAWSSTGRVPIDDHPLGLQWAFQRSKSSEDSQGGGYYNFRNLDATSGRTYSLWVRCLGNPMQFRIRCERYPEENSGTTLSISGDAYTVGEEWQRVSIHVPYEEGRTRHVVTMYTLSSTAVAGDLQMTGLLAEASDSPEPGSYFDGDFQADPDPDLTPSWTGTVGYSESVLTAPAPARTVPGTNAMRGWQSGAWSADREKSLRIRSLYDASNAGSYIGATGVTFTPGVTYTARAVVRIEAPLVGPMRSERMKLQVRSGGTIVASSNLPPNEAGEHEVSVTWVATENNTLRLYHGGTYQAGDVWFDNLTVVEGDRAAEYFDGDTIPDDDELVRYLWTGAPDDSQSIREGREASEREQTDEEYAPVVDGLRRFMHDVGVTSGPITVEQMAFRNPRGYYGITLEWTITSERAWIYSKTRPVSLPVTPTVVIQDTPYNLVPYPSMELSSGSVVAATNYSLNPSLEVNATGWSSGSSAVSGSAPAAFVSSSRVTGELQAVGNASYRVRLLGTTTAASGRAQLRAEQAVDLAARPANSRVSVSIWAALLSLGPTTPLHSLEAEIEWQTVSAASISTVQLEPGPGGIGGQSFSAKSLLPPSNATQAIVRVRGEFDWTSGTVKSDVRLYADAVAVTVP